MSDLDATPNDSLSRPNAVLKQAVRLLRPLVHLFIKTGITFPALCDLLRELYVSVAETEFALSGKAQTDSRVSLLTGLHRREVKRLRDAGIPVSDIPVSLSRSSQIIARWTGMTAYTDSDGLPRPLSRVSNNSDESSFEDLVQLITKDVRPRAVLDDLLNEGIVRLGDDGKIILQSLALIPKPGQDDQLYYFGRNLHDHIAASVSNVLADGPVHFEQAVHYGSMSEQAALGLYKEATEVAMNMLLLINKQALEARTLDNGGDWQWTLGVYVYREEKSSEAE